MLSRALSVRLLFFLRARAHSEPEREKWNAAFCMYQITGSSTYTNNELLLFNDNKWRFFFGWRKIFESQEIIKIDSGEEEWTKKRLNKHTYLSLYYMWNE